jgi:membrane protein implicated in regulation of membrane protease activity
MKKKLMSILGICLGLVSFVSADFGSGCFGGMMSGTYFNPFSWIIQLLVIVVLGLLIAWLWKQIQKKDEKKKR